MARRPRKKTIQDLVADWEPKLRDAFLAAVQNLRDGVEVTRLVNALKTGNVREAFEAVHFELAAYGVYADEITAGFKAAGDLTVSNMPPLRDQEGNRAVLRFDMRDPIAEEWIRDHSSQAIKEISDDLRNSIQETLEQGLQEG